MACTAEDNPCFVAGDDLSYKAQFTDSEEVGRDLTGATAKMDLREIVTDADPVAQSLSGGIVTPLTGSMIFTLTDDETKALLPRNTESKTWAFSIKIFFADATELTILSGLLQLTQAATA